MTNKYTDLQTIYQLQKSIAKQNMHNAMSPISAISGYLELLNRSLVEEVNKERIDNYRKKIQNGVSELHNILGQLNDIYDEEFAEELNDQNTSVEINWLVRNICKQRKSAAPAVHAVCSSNPLHVRTHLFKVKLILSNLINFAERVTTREVIKVETNKVGNKATIAIQFQISSSKKDRLQKLLETENITLEESNSFNRGLLNSVRLAEQLDGEINMKDGMEGYTALYLALPLALKQQPQKFAGLTA